MGIKEWLIPQEKIFFELIEKESALVLNGANALVDMLKIPDGVENKAKKIKEIEHQSDEIVHTIFSELNKTFITPIDREDISLLASRLDDVIDWVDASANRFHLYQLNLPTKPMIELAEIIAKSAKELNNAITNIRNLNNYKTIENSCIEVNRLENSADDILNKSLAELFKETDPISIMKNKEIIEYLELATDKCEDVANVIGDILLKHR